MPAARRRARRMTVGHALDELVAPTPVLVRNVGDIVRVVECIGPCGNRRDSEERQQLRRSRRSRVDDATGQIVRRCPDPGAVQKRPAVEALPKLVVEPSSIGYSASTPLGVRSTTS